MAVLDTLSTNSTLALRFTLYPFHRGANLVDQHSPFTRSINKLFFKLDNRILIIRIIDMSANRVQRLISLVALHMQSRCQHFNMRIIIFSVLSESINQ
jgi:hypothetical protein